MNGGNLVRQFGFYNNEKTEEIIYQNNWITNHKITLNNEYVPFKKVNSS